MERQLHHFSSSTPVCSMAHTSQQVAETILRQLGGGRFLAMTGARNLSSSENSLTFALPRIAANKITHARITLDPSDTYTVEFLNCRLTRSGLKQETVERSSGVCVENLQQVFTAATGLRTRL